MNSMMLTPKLLGEELNGNAFLVAGEAAAGTSTVDFFALEDLYGRAACLQS